MIRDVAWDWWLNGGEKKDLDPSTTSCWEGQCLTIAQRGRRFDTFAVRMGPLVLDGRKSMVFAPGNRDDLANIFADCSDTPPEV